jgi:hypothetical protein
MHPAELIIHCFTLTGGLNVSPQQQQIFEYIASQKGEWVNAKQIAEFMQIRVINIHNHLKKMDHPCIYRSKKAVEGTKTPFIVWKYSDTNAKTDTALRLAKKYPGIWGQLSFGSHYA